MIFSGSRDNSIRVWDISALTHTHTLDDSDVVIDIALTTDEQHLVSCSDDKSLKVWCTASLTCLRNVELADYSFALAVSQPGDVVAVVFYFSTTKLYASAQGSVWGRWTHKAALLPSAPAGGGSSHQRTTLLSL
eukprot:TRINITY_DN8972_c0_g2_i2.p1 TRINITY_DN8972_c0_g2~~TRINITY_DN8972_c0_g2_i2.p1  ORF type:complete len:151 (+),score=27.87 TRINITY_DN8972_c0_g2_i2:52-453(+)